MFIGHYCAAIAVKGYAPQLPFWALLIAAQWVDIVWAVLIVSGIEGLRFDASLASNPLDLYHIPYTHSLLATVCWTLASFAVLRVFAGHLIGTRGAALLAAVVASHWFADLLVHRPDLLVWGELKVGLGLWNYPLLSFLLELGLVLGALFYALSRQAFSYRQRRRLLIFGLSLVALHVLSVVLAPPMSIVELVVPAVLCFLGLPLLAYALVDRLDRRA